jgi:hypothetical protein
MRRMSRPPTRFASCIRRKSGSGRCLMDGEGKTVGEPWICALRKRLAGAAQQRAMRNRIR